MTIWGLIRPYWFSEDKLKGRLLLATIVGLALGQVYITVLLNKWNAKFYNALQDKDLPEFKHQLLIFCGLAAAFIAVAVYRQYFNQMLQMRWRRWMTDRYQEKWLAQHNYYKLQVIYKNADNPDQRIADDVDIFTGSTLSLSIGLMSSVVTLVSFIGILWGLSGVLEFTVAGQDVAIQGYMVWAAIVYALIGTWLTHKIGRRLVSLTFNQQRFEANFRYALIRLRENAESVAFYHGEPAERSILRERFSHILDNWWQIMKKQKQLTWFTSGYGQLAIIFPIVVAAPRYFSGAIQLGGLMQTASAFGRVQDALSWLIDVYPQYANWKATTNRLVGFHNAMEEAEKAEASRNIVSVDTAGGFAVKGLSITLPDGTALVNDFAIALKPGDRLLLTGKSGSGKTTVLRALAGLWPFGTGEVQMPQNANLMFVPQKPYIPILPLREVMSYPNPPAIPAGDDAELAAALGWVGMEALLPMLDADENWSQRLSLGEQQKLAIARVLLQKPDILLLDEATSSLDEAAESTLYEMLSNALLNAIIISVGHRSSLKQWHNSEYKLPRHTALDAAPNSR